jgi:hypothetical protein
MGGMAAAFLTPQIDAYFDALINEEPEAIDAFLASLIDRIGGLRSDTERSIVTVPSEGAFYIDEQALSTIEPTFGTPVSAARVRDGGDGVGEVDTDAKALSVGSGAEAGN